MPTTAPYDEIADWYESTFLSRQRARPQPGGFADALGIDRAVVELLGPADAGSRGLEVGCGTGVYGPRLCELGWQPVGVDISAGMLRHARGRMPVVQGDATRLPVATGALDAVITVMVHTDLPDYAPVLAEAHRVLRPGGRFVHVGVHPCFCGGFADRTDPEAVVIRPGYLDGSWTTDSWTDQGVRDKVGATHVPLGELLTSTLAAGFVLEAVTEGDGPTPVVLGARWRRPAA